MRNKLLLGLLCVGGILAAPSSCSLSNIAADDCTTNDECVLAIGPKSMCEEGFCTDPPSCTTGHDCRMVAGGGACVSGVCVSTFPKHPQCQTIYEPADVFDVRLGAPDAPLVIGSIVSVEEQKDEVRTRAMRLAVREINDKGGKMNRGQRLALVVCDVGGPGNTAKGAEREELNNQALDYLAGTLGVPVIIGPSTSSDALQTVARLKEKSYPTALISPSATSPALTKIDDRLSPGEPGLFWRTCPSDVQQGQVLAGVISADMTILKTAVVYVNDAYGQGLAEVFSNSYGLERSERIPIDEAKVTDPAETAKIAEQVEAYEPDAVLVIAVQGGQTVEILKAMVGKSVAQKKFFFTDGSKDEGKLFAPGLPAEVTTMIQGAQGTAPASPSGTNYEFFRTNLKSAFEVDAAGFSFTAQAYDATYVGAYGIIWASRESSAYDGRQVAEGLSKLSMGTTVNVSVVGWTSGKNALAGGGGIDIEGASGRLNFNKDTGEAPGRIEIWGVNGSSFVTMDVVE
ncbi:ABC transporter substrate-binding protein [Polyangium aurulentum]|uniref:ABC transporter substrate-binding protein n=1 Tax=Polyangium aurulentum TaxID=2567896 RepID=UPI0010AE79D7|nr:ABC transporter substrate-binding protein [Polyangium aurulentum]UQA60228.1 ABC transporter substrate-binding protein [Polyangium aurulentum]